MFDMLITDMFITCTCIQIKIFVLTTKSNSLLLCFHRQNGGHLKFRKFVACDFTNYSFSRLKKTLFLKNCRFLKVSNRPEQKKTLVKIKYIFAKGVT